MTIRYHYSRPGLDDADRAEVAAALQDVFLTQGPRVAAFEDAFGGLVDGAEAVACSSGTAALHLAFMAAGLGPGAGLLTTPVTFVATASAARFCGAPVVFADVDPATGNLDPAAARRVLQETDLPLRAIAAVHMAGRPCEMMALRALADEFDCLLIEDACHATGARYVDDAGASHAAGGCAHADLAAFSFHAIKHISMGEGGAATTRNPEFASRMRALRNHGIHRAPADWSDPPEPDAPWYYEVHEPGLNYRLTDIQCALGQGQIARLPAGNRRRSAIAALYDGLLADLAHVATPPPPARPDGHAWHLYPLAIDFTALGKTRGEIMRALAARGVGSQVHYIPLYRQPVYRDTSAGSFPGAEAWYAQTLSIPMYPQLADDEVREIAGILHEVVAA